jgi:exosortase D (VPLPA-CTERM-specific)
MTTKQDEATIQPSDASPVVWKLSLPHVIVLVIVAAFLIGIFYAALAQMVRQWISTEEYGYGFIIPVISALLVWQLKDKIGEIPFKGTWFGAVIVLAGMFLFFLGELSTIYIVSQYAFLIVVAGSVLSLMGWRSFRLVAVPLLLLFFMIPLPVFLYQGLSSWLQLVSSEIGVAFIRMMGISVYLEGNVIDLGSYKLQVVEACSGLRYLFPLSSLAFISAYIFKGAIWKKAIIFLSSIPITVAMNSFRIGIIGVLVEFQGPSAAEGFLHYFEGWVIFMTCMAILIGEMWLLSRVGRDRRPFAEAFNLELPSGSVTPTRASPRTLAKPFIASALIAVAALPVVLVLDKRSETVPDREDFVAFPMELGEWHGKRGYIESIYLDVLKLDDYLIADFVSPRKDLVNFYVAYYSSQRKGESAHSPRSCIPGGGWQIKEITTKGIDGVMLGGAPLKVNRVIIQNGDNKQLVYYWFQQRGRNITNEYLVKWFIFWDALTRNRTDGALVRLTAFVPSSQDLAEADRLLADFSRVVADPLRNYVPE